jgi:hypothetical protein
MKFLSILAAASLALAPAIASAESHTDSTDNGSPIPGPLAGHALEDSKVPYGAIVLGGLVIIGGVVIAVIGGNDSNNNTND